MRTTTKNPPAKVQAYASTHGIAPALDNQDGSPPETISRRIDAARRIEKPARMGRLKLAHTLDAKPASLSFACMTFTFYVPAWLDARNDRVWPAVILRDWMRNARFLNDPVHGEFTRARYLDRWEKVMRHRETWMHRDKQTAVKITLSIADPFADNLASAAEFLNVSREMILVAVLAAKAMERTQDDGPEWNDFANLQAGQR